MGEVENNVVVLPIDVQIAEESVSFNVEKQEKDGSWRPYASVTSRVGADDAANQYKQKLPEYRFRVEHDERRHERVDIMAGLLARDRIQMGRRYWEILEKQDDAPGKYKEEIERIDAILAQAEGRE